MPVYATSDEYEDYTGTPGPADISLRLTRASRTIRSNTITAVYDVGDDQLPTDETIADAFREATIEQAAAWIASGVEDGTGASGRWANVSIGSAALGGAQSGGAGGGGSAVDCLAPQAEMVLQDAGLLGQAPRSYPPCEVADG